MIRSGADVSSATDNIPLHASPPSTGTSSAFLTDCPTCVVVWSLCVCTREKRTRRMKRLRAFCDPLCAALLRHSPGTDQKQNNEIYQSKRALDFSSRLRLNPSSLNRVCKCRKSCRCRGSNRGSPKRSSAESAETLALSLVRLFEYGPNISRRGGDYQSVANVTCPRRGAWETSWVWRGIGSFAQS